MTPKVSVLFLCTGNSARSQMAEGFLRHFAGDRFEACSAGLDPAPIHPMTVRVMRERGIDISSQRSKDLKEYLGRKSFRYVIIVCEQANRSCPRLWPGVTERLLRPFDDPAKAEGSEEERLDKFRQVRDQVEARIKTWLTDLEKQEA